MQFWSNEPIAELDQRRGSLPYGLYPAMRYYHGIHPEMSQHRASQGPYNRGVLEKMVDWCVKNCKGLFTFSEAYGSFYFELAEDRGMFRMFFDSLNMPTPTVVI